MASKAVASRWTAAEVEQFCSITGADENVAERMLEACNGNIQLAIEMHMDGGEMCHSGPQPSGSSSGAPGHSSSTPVADQAVEEEDVRAPIPQRNETLVEETPAGFGFHGRRRKARSVFDGFRDFQAEARQQEEMMSAGASTFQSKRQTLEDLFRPPIDVMYKGSFASAREHGKTCQKWLMVNIQNVQEFACQALNRDVWSNNSVKSIIKSKFIFWQVYHDSDEGGKYTQFYKVKNWPYVSIIDPRTGENMVTWDKLDPMIFCELANEFLADNPYCGSDSETSPSPAKRPRVASIVDASEDSQLQAAIKASLTKSTSSNPVIIDSESDLDSDNDLETFTDSEDEAESSTNYSPVKCESKQNNTDSVVKSSNTDNTSGEQMSEEKATDLSDDASQDSDSKEENTKSADTDLNSEKYKSFLGKDDDPQTSLMIRFPDGKRQQWLTSCNSKLMALVLYVGSQGYPNERFELVTNFPKRKLSYMDFDITVKDAGLHPQESIFVQAR
ncbi:UBX domain-containing protein 7-like isoform X2 [Mizuhopecten yessoensis]|uniref:UBX domain-containing protein 7-like isoform X2 n=1 Tax=Mizuhopecten yessoensis TaxID=6573 RepID=UPI000B45F282|nr:UBX domain-containing protein 7-like isoform X2 [Mizuhopecten yessoensis]